MVFLCGAEFRPLVVAAVGGEGGGVIKEKGLPDHIDP